jgi:ketosteroid isomerase-like protein
MRLPATVAILFLISLPLLAGCGGGPKQASAVDTAAIALAVDGVTRAFNAAIVARDTAAIDSLYAADASVLPPHMPRVDGREAIHRWWAVGLTAPNLQLVLVSGHTTVAQAGDMAVEVGTYDYRATGPKGEVLREVGKYVNVLKPEGNRWRIVVDTWNSDQPLPGPGK